MANNKQDKSSDGKGIQLAVDRAVDRGLLNYLGGTEGLINNERHVSVSIQVTSADGAASSLVISEIKNVSEKAPVFITRPVKLKLAKLNAFLKEQNVDLADYPALDRLLENTSISCEAFYYTGKEGPLLMIFELNFGAVKEAEKKDGNAKEDPDDNNTADKDSKGGLIYSLSGSEELGELFDIASVSLRVFRCNKDYYSRLKAYCAALQG